MELTFTNPGFEYMLDKIMAFQTEGVSPFWTEPLFHFYPELDKEYADSLHPADRIKYLERNFSEIYAARESIINEKVVMYSNHWGACKPQITSALSDAFECDLSRLFDDLKCNVSLNPIEPRFLKEHSFDIFYLNSERGAVGEAIHEIIHFVWFYVWNRVFGDSYDEYESPSLKWILSEMIVEAVMKDLRLSSINPYFPRENGGCIYPYFFDMKVNGGLILNTLDEMYQEMCIADFMKSSYAYCAEHEDAIRAHIRKSEMQSEYNG